MKKSFISVLAILSLAAVSCRQVEMPFTHEDSDVVITSMLMWNLPYEDINPDSKFSIKESVEAVIAGNEDPEAVGEIVFAVPREKRELWDLTDVRIQATVTYDVDITPSLAGSFDLTRDDEGNPRLYLTVKSNRTGFEKHYKVYAYIKRTD